MRGEALNGSGGDHVSYPPYFKSHNIDALLEAVHKAVVASSDWRVYKVGALGNDRFVAADYTGSKFGSSDLGFVLTYYPHNPGKAYLTMHSKSWNSQSGRQHFSSQYQAAEKLAMPIFRAAGGILGRRLRLVCPKDRINPLRGKIGQAFHRFAFLANKGCLHPLDELRFYEFIRCAHKFTSVLTPRDVAFHLRQAGFREDMRARLADEYELGRRVLAVEIWPWELLTAVLPKERVCHSEARLRAEESCCGAAGTARFFASLRMTTSSLPYL